MLASFDNKGFHDPDCEFIYVNNSEENNYDAYSGYNLFLNIASGEFVILCHQDILLIDDGREKLDKIIAELDSR